MKDGSASSTAKAIAASTILLNAERDGSTQVAPGAAGLCEVFLSTTAADRCLAFCAAHPVTRPFLRLLERMTLPGIISHYWRRKRWIERRCRTAIDEGFQRIVVLGAGFDTLGMRLATEFPDLEIIEMDHPATQRVKREALESHSVSLSDNFKWATADFTQGKLRSLAKSDKSTVFVMEGLLMYLSPEDVSTLFEDLLYFPGQKTRVIFSFMSIWPDGGSGFRPRSRMIEGWLRWKQEPFTWAIQPERISCFLSELGYNLLELALTHDLDPENKPPVGGLDGENLVVCDLIRKE